MLNVLVIDDDKNLCDCLVKLIPWRDYDYDIPYVANDGEEGLRRFLERKFDLVICDLKMPVMDGLGFIRSIRDLGYQTDVVLLSAYEDFESAREALSLRVINYISKPINKNSLTLLEGILSENVKKRARNNQYFTESFRQEMIQAMVKKDGTYVHEQLSQLKSVSNEELLDIGFLFIDIIYDFKTQMMKEKNPETVSVETRTSRNTFRMTGNSNERIAYLQDLYDSVFQEIISGETSGNERNLVQKIRELIEDGFPNPDCSISWIADQCGHSAAYVGRIFREETGMGIVECIADRRMKKAQNYLRSTNLSVSEISRECGYLDAGYFSKVFRNTYRMSPTEYRERNQ